jgi:hypothetical protein
VKGGDEDMGLIIGIGKKPEKKADAGEGEGSGEVDMKAAKSDSARALVASLGLDPDALDMDAVEGALEDFVAACGGY